MACPRAWPRHRTPVLHEEQAVKPSRPHARDSRALGNHPNRVIPDPACPPDTDRVAAPPGFARSASPAPSRCVEPCLSASVAASSASAGAHCMLGTWNTLAACESGGHGGSPVESDSRGHGASRDRTGDLLLATPYAASGRRSVIRSSAPGAGRSPGSNEASIASGSARGSDRCARIGPRGGGAGGGRVRRRRRTAIRQRQARTRLSVATRRACHYAR
jgi:hypothetical protein